MDFELLLEAERRGILPADKQALLNEARQRGMIPTSELEQIALAARRKKLAARVEAAKLAQGANAQGEQPGGVSTNSEAISDFKRKMGAGIAGAVNGATFGLADEATGLIGGVGSMLSGDGFSSGYTSERDAVRAEHAKRQQADPMEYGAGQIGGAVVPAIATAPLATGATGLGTVGRGIALGGAEGALHGFGNGEGMDGRIDGAKWGAVSGAAFGGAVPMAVGGARLAYRTFADPLAGAMNIGNTSRANRAIAATVRKSGRSADDIADDIARAAAQGQPEYRVMDALGLAGQRRASGLARGGGQAGEDIAEFLSRRQLDQGDRVAGFVDEAFGLNGSTAAKTRDSLIQRRGQAADAAYSAARGNAAPVDVRSALSVIDDRIGGMQGVDIAGDGIDGRLTSFRNRLTANKTPDGVNSIELSDFDRVLGVKQDVQDAIGAAVRAGRNNEARELGKLADALDQALEASSDMYRTANDGFRNASRVIDAVDQGAGMTARNTRAADNVAAFNAMTPEQQAAARVGYGDRALARLEANPAPTANKAQPFRSTKAQTEADAMARDPTAFRSRMDRENQMWETQNRALGGSRTADNLEDIGASGQIAQQATGIGGALATGNIGHAISGAVGALAPRLTGQNEATRLLMARALMSGKPRQTIAPVYEAYQRQLVRQRMLEALIRNSAPRGADGM